MDVFSYGILVCEMSICELPLTQQNERKNQINRINDDHIKHLVQRCTEIDPNERPTIQDVIGIWAVLDSFDA